MRAVSIPCRVSKVTPLGFRQGGFMANLSPVSIPCRVSKVTPRWSSPVPTATSRQVSIPCRVSKVTPHIVHRKNRPKPYLVSIPCRVSKVTPLAGRLGTIRWHGRRSQFPVGFLRSLHWSSGGRFIRPTASVSIPCRVSKVTPLRGPS